MATNPLKDKLVLVVDDEPRMIQFVRMNLEAEGARVTEAHNGVEALNQVREKIPDAVILDVMMPELDGLDTAAAARDVGRAGHYADRLRGRGGARARARARRRRLHGQTL